MIDELKLQIKNINENVRMLEENRSVLYSNFTEEVHSIKETRIKSLLSYSEIMQNSSKLFHQGELYAIQNDYLNKNEKIKERIKQYIKFKYDFLKNDFPEIAEYFEQHGSDSYLYKAIWNGCEKQEKNLKLKRINVNDNDMEILLKKNDNNLWALNGNNLICGDTCLKDGNYVTMKIGNSNEYFGTLSINNNIIYFCGDDSKKIKITLQGLNIGIIVLKKK